MSISPGPPPLRVPMYEGEALNPLWERWFIGLWRASGTSPPGGTGVASIVAGTNISIKPVAGTGIVTINSAAASGFFALDGLDGDEGMPIPGPAGAAGSVGPVGPQGMIGIGLDGADPDEFLIVPGQTGSTGATGQQGIPGIGLDGQDADEIASSGRSFGTMAYQYASGSPASATITTALTGVAAFKPSDTTAATNVLTADATLSLTFNETGKYAFELWLPFFEATLGTGGFQFDLNSGTATVGAIVYGVDGFSTASVINAGITSVATATSAGSVATSSTAPSWFFAKGWLSITVAGTLVPRWAQASTLGADPTTLKTGAYFMAIKIG